MARRKLAASSGLHLERGRDEMNLAEFPLAVLSQRLNTGLLKFQKTRTLVLPDGTIVNQEWTVTGDPEYGLPQPVDEDVLLGLLKIASDDGFESPEVRFTQRALISVLQWNRQGWHHRRLEQALSRLKTTTIKAKNAFWNNQAKAYQTVHFGIIDAYELYERQSTSHVSVEMALAANRVRFSKEFFSSIQAGYLKPLDLAIYFSLKRALTKRLFRYLDKKRFHKQRYEINIHTLASVHLGMSDSTCKYASWIKKELDRAHDELCEVGFLQEASYDRMKDGGWKVIYHFHPPRTRDGLVSLPVVEASPVDVVGLLVARGVSQATAEDIANRKSAEFIESQVNLFDAMQARGAKAVQNPAGFLVRALQQEWTIVPPAAPAPARERRKRGATAESDVAEGEAERDEVQRVSQALPAETLQALRDEARAQVSRMLGRKMAGSQDGPLVEAVLHDLVRQRYLAAP